MPRLACLALIASLALTAAADDENSLPLVNPVTSTPSSSSGVQWVPLLRESLFFLSVEHGFRVATDPDTRRNLGGPFWKGYADSVGNLHGWADGDPFFVNYIGHPMQGAVSGDIWIHNDPAYRTAEFGKDRRYWVGRLRAAAFAWAYSEQFEIGPVSEASIGHVQSRFPQQGFVDHVITPTVGIAWMIGEDAIDRFLIERIERRTGNRWIRIAARGFLNPAHAFADCMTYELPWYRERDRSRGPESLTLIRSEKPVAPREPRDVPAFEFTTHFNQMVLTSGSETVPCTGGGGSGVFNLNPVLGIEADVSGCKMLGLNSNLSGDVTTFMVGPKFSYRGAGRWTPWFHGLAGGEKVTEELLLPQTKNVVTASAAPGTPAYVLHDQYTEPWESTAFAASLGGGLDWILNRSVAFRLGSVDYTHAWMSDARVHSSNLQLTMGFVLRVGD
jgi:hypothetical protein